MGGLCEDCGNSGIVETYVRHALNPEPQFVGDVPCPICLEKETYEVFYRGDNSLKELSPPRHKSEFEAGWVKVRDVRADSRVDVLQIQQADVWGGGKFHDDVLALIVRLGLKHLSMSVGDIVKGPDGFHLVIQSLGFRWFRLYPERPAAVLRNSNNVVFDDDVDNERISVGLHERIHAYVATIRGAGYDCMPVYVGAPLDPEEERDCVHIRVECSTYARWSDPYSHTFHLSHLNALLSRWYEVEYEGKGVFRIFKRGKK